MSEGRREDVIHTIAAAAWGARLLDVLSDRDHNRALLTFVGSPEAVIEAAFRVAVSGGAD